MSIFERCVKFALNLGFSHAVLLENLKIQCNADIRAYCNSAQCPKYGTTWVCPPGCGSIEECQNAIDIYDKGIVLQSINQVPLSEDKWTKLNQFEREHNKRLLHIADIARQDSYDVLPLTTGGCIVCPQCTFPEEPCREPKRRMHSLSAYGIDVSLLCESAGLEFSFKDGIVYYVGCLMLK